MLARVPWIYRQTRRVFRQAVDFYFLELQVSGAIPADGALLVASNHPNSIMDTLVLGSVIDREIHFLARSGLFSNPFVGAFLRSAGAIPIYRRQDGPTDPSGNQDAFRAAYEVLERGEVIGIFPEGQNAPIRHVRDIKTGVARIGLGTKAAVKIVPIGLNYEDRDRFLARVLVRIGEPIDVGEWSDAHREDPRKAARELTDVVQERMRKLAVHVADLEQTELVHAIDALVGEELQEELIGKIDLRTVDEKLLKRAVGRGVKHADLEGRFQVRQWIADAVDYFEHEDPEGVEQLRRGIHRYTTHLRQLRLRADFADRPAKTLSARREALRWTTYAIALAPIALWGLVHNFIPYRLTRRFALGAKEEAIRAIRAVMGSFMFFGLFYALYGGSVYGGTGHWWAVALYLLSLPIAGVWYLRYVQRLRLFRSRILVRTLFRTRRRLFRSLVLEREQLLVRIDVMKRAYRAHRESSAGSLSPSEPASE